MYFRGMQWTLVGTGAVALLSGACSSGGADAPSGSSGASSGGTAGASSTSGATGLGGQSTAGSNAAGGASGSSSASGSSGSGGAAGGGGATMGGGATVGGGGNSAGAGGMAGSGGGGAIGLKNAPVKSKGCGQALGALTTGSHMITSSGSQREYTIDIPADYDKDKPYRLFFTFHWIGASDKVLVDGLVEGNESTGGPDKYAYYGLKRQATMANEPAIFIAPSGIGGSWGQVDHVLFDDLLALAKDSLCIDTSRVFATGFSFGAMITYSLSTNHQKDLRAVVTYAPANYNIYLPTNTHEAIPFMSTTGMSDGTCPFIHDAGKMEGGKFAALGHAMDNGCTMPTTLPTTTVGSKAHVCYDFEGCKAGFPVKTCTFDGGHQASVADGGTQNNGLTSWIPTEAWKFFTQF